MGRASRGKRERGIKQIIQAQGPVREMGRQIVQQQTLRAGPIPSPDELEHYERIHSGPANRIMAMAENEAASRQRQTETALAGKIADDQKARTEKRIG